MKKSIKFMSHLLLIAVLSMLATGCLLPGEKVDVYVPPSQNTTNSY